MNIIILAIIQGVVFDFLIYYCGFKEQQLRAKHYGYWIFKAIFDFPITIIISYYLGIKIETLILFYFLKWLGFCDLFYIVAWMIVKRKVYEPDNELYWLFYTPLGLIRTLQVLLLKGYAREALKANDPVNWWKGCITMKEYYFQLAIGILIIIIKGII